MSTEPATAACDGCGQAFAPGELTTGELGTQWCAICVASTSAPAPAPAPAFDHIEEDDGEP